VIGVVFESGSPAKSARERADEPPDETHVGRCDFDFVRAVADVHDPTERMLRHLRLLLTQYQGQDFLTERFENLTMYAEDTGGTAVRNASAGRTQGLGCDYGTGRPCPAIFMKNRTAFPACRWLR
jgi:hypothetical protein